MAPTKSYQIVNLKGRDIVARKCKCTTFLTPIIQSQSRKEDHYYCNRCKVAVTTFLSHFKIDLVLLDLFTSQLIEVTLYDKIAIEFMGCTPIEYMQFTKRDDKLYQKLEDIAMGLFVDAEIVKNVKK